MNLHGREGFLNLLKVLIALLMLGVMGGQYYLVSKGDNTDFAEIGSKHVIAVKPGMTTVDIAELLHAKNLVRDPENFRWEARMKGLATKLQAGIYVIEGGWSNAEIVSTMAKGRIKLVQFTVPEGYNVVKTAQKLEGFEMGSAAKFMEAARNYAPYDYMATEDPNVIFKAEGFIYPATYEIPWGISEEEILAILVRGFHQAMEDSGVLQTVEERQMNLRDVVNLAAMVELEAVYPEEQPRIAGVFSKRLAIDMPIQSDTTIQYILGAQKELITFKDTEIENPYNTYQNYGLPPGPIASPSLKAIKAVLAPEEHDYLYFVAEPDGHHRFTSTYSQHLQAINDIDNGR